jgi:hypothetical protein
MRGFKTTLPLLGAALLLPVGFLIGLGVRSPSAPQIPPFRPFVLFERELNKSADNTVTKEVNFTVVRRGDGSLMRSFVISAADSPGGEEGKVVFIWDMAARAKVTLEPFTKSAMTQHLSDAEITDFLSSEHECTPVEGPPPDGIQTPTIMLGHAVTRTEESDDILRVVRWGASDLDCYPLAKTTWFLEPRRGGAYQETIVTKIELGQPGNVFSRYLRIIRSGRRWRSRLRTLRSFQGSPFLAPSKPRTLSGSIAVIRLVRRRICPSRDACGEFRQQQRARSLLYTHRRCFALSAKPSIDPGSRCAPIAKRTWLKIFRNHLTRQTPTWQLTT